MTENIKSFRRTFAACYVGNTNMAMIVNILPIIYIALQEQYGMTYRQFGLLIFLNFLTQVTVDVVFSFFVDKYGFRRFILASPILTVIGILIFIGAPNLSDDPFKFFVLGTIIYSGSCGLLELLLSPIVNSIPTKGKSAAMSGLHAMYNWGMIFVIVVTTLSLYVFGRENWQYIMGGWLILPIIDFFLFLKAPLMPPIPEEKRQNFKHLDSKYTFILLFMLIVFGGASEQGMAQWTSVFAEKALGISKVMGDLLGLSLFALFMGIGRTAHSLFGEKLNIRRLLTLGFAASIVCYVAAALFHNPYYGLAACALSGIGVSLLWPGTLIFATEKFPLAGTWIFAILAAGGDFGCSVGPWAISRIVDYTSRTGISDKFSFLAAATAEQTGLKAGLLFGSILPLLGLFVVLMIGKKVKKNRD